MKRHIDIPIFGVHIGVIKPLKEDYPIPLTDTAIRAAKPAEKAQKLFDGKGLYLLITPGGTKSWRLKYHFQGKEKLISLGTYPATSLKKAREKAIEARKAIESGIDPSAQRKLDKQLAQNTFELVAMEWIERQKTKWSPSYAETTYRRLKRNIFSFTGSKPVNTITAPELLALLRKVEARGIIGTAHTLKNHCSCIMRYAIATGRAEREPAADLRGALMPHVKKHRPVLTTPEKVGRLMHAIYNYQGFAGRQERLADYGPYLLPDNRNPLRRVAGV